MRRLALAAGLLPSLGVVFFANAGTAQATAMPGCAYPYVCILNGNGAKTGQFRDFTSGWQWLTASRGDWTVQNTRDDDVVYVLRYHPAWSSGPIKEPASYSTGCVSPNNTTTFDGGEIVAIRIDASSTCWPNTPPLVVNSRQGHGN